MMFSVFVFSDNLQVVLHWQEKISDMFTEICGLYALYKYEG